MMQELFPDVEPTEADLVQRALSQPRAAKYDRAIALLRHYEPFALKLDPRGAYLAFSGGKDSIVIKQLAIEAGIKFAPYYNQTTIDPPELIRFIRKYHADVLWNKPEMNMLTRLSVKSKGPPTRLGRWCCEVYKEQGGNGMLKVLGVRVSESVRRASMWKEFVPNRNHDDGGILAPIAYWTDADVWDFIKSRNLPYPELYDQGFTRLGCIGCPLAGKHGQDKEFARWPGYERAWKRAIFRFWDNWHNVPLENPYWETIDPKIGPHRLADGVCDLPVSPKDAKRLGCRSARSCPRSSTTGAGLRICCPPRACGSGGAAAKPWPENPAVFSKR